MERGESIGVSLSSSTSKRRPRRTPGQTNWDTSKTQSDKYDSDVKYSAALKEATLLHRAKSNKLSYGQIVKKTNRKHGLEGKVLTKTTLHRYLKQDHVGMSPTKRGRRSIIPQPFWDLLNCHVSMTQLEGREETKPRHLKALIGAALKNTEYADLDAGLIYRRFRTMFPDTVSPTRAMEMEERCLLWTVFPNVSK